MKKNRYIYELLRADGSIIVNKRLAQAIGLNEAVIFSELVSRYLYFLDRDKLTPDGYFFNTVEDLQEGTTIKEWEQRKCIKKLVELGLIKIKIMGVPAKRHFKLPENSADILISLLEEKEKLQDGAKCHDVSK